MEACSAPPLPVVQPTQYVEEPVDDFAAGTAVAVPDVELVGGSMVIELAARLPSFVAYSIVTESPTRRFASVSGCLSLETTVFASTR